MLLLLLLLLVPLVPLPSACLSFDPTGAFGTEIELKQLYARDVVTKGHRPKLQPWVPQPWQDLICQCWKAEPSLRPTAAETLAELRTIPDTCEPVYLQSLFLKHFGQ